MVNSPEGLTPTTQPDGSTSHSPAPSSKGGWLKTGIESAFGRDGLFIVSGATLDRIGRSRVNGGLGSEESPDVWMEFELDEGGEDVYGLRTWRCAFASISDTRTAHEDCEIDLSVSMRPGLSTRGR